MAAMQRVTHSSVSTSVASSYSSCKGGVASGSVGEAGAHDQFPAGLRVLVVDDDVTCLRILEQMLNRCRYHVTTCSEATHALNLLRERKGCFDVVLSDVHMPDMDGYKLLEHVGLEMDLPVIMMSADGRTSAVMRGIRHGACDYLIKPIREEELKNIWQHVVRKRWNENKELEHSESLEENDQHKRGNDDVEYDSSANEGIEGALKAQKKRSSAKDEEDGELENDDPSTSKKPRVVWSVELHQQFVSAVNQLGLDKAVPKRILELMNVPGLTRENVASHLQKFRLYLKRLSGVAQQQGGVSNTICGDSNVKLGSLGRFDIPALAASGQIPPQTLAALHAELLGRPAGNIVAAMDQPALLQASLQGSKRIPVEHGVAFGQPLVSCQSNVSKHFQQPIVSSVEEVSSGLSAWQSNNLGTVAPSTNLTGLSAQNSNMLMDILQQQQRQQQQSILPEANRSINVQPSCFILPSQSSASFQAGNSPASISQNCSFNNSSVIDYSLLSSQPSNSSLNIAQFSNGALKSTGVLTGYSAPGSISPLSSCSVNVDGMSLQGQSSTVTFSTSRHLPGVVSNMHDIQGSYVVKTGELLDQVPVQNNGFVGKGTCIPSRFAVDDFESQMNNLSHGKLYVESNRVKQEPNVDFVDNARMGMPAVQQFSSNDVMSVFTE